MTLEKLSQKLNTLAPTFQLAAPSEITRCIVYTVTGHTRAYTTAGDPVELAHVTLIVTTQSTSDVLYGEVKALLDEAAIPYEEEGIKYDDQYAVLRMTLKIGLLLVPPGPEPSNPTYITISYTSYPRLHADGRPRALVYYVTLNYHCPVNYNYRPALTTIKERLWKAGCTYPTETETSLDDGQRRLTLEFQWREGLGAASNG